MSSASPERRPTANRNVPMPPTDKRLLAAAGVCLLIPIVALMWVGSYNQVTPRLGGIPFFFWYQFLWVFICSGLTYAAHRLVLAARGGRSGMAAHPHPHDGPPDRPVGDDDRRDPMPGYRS